MTLSLLTEPDDKASAYRPVIWEVQTNRLSYESNNVTAVSDSGSGFCQFEVGSHNFKQFDVITGSGFTDTSYNVRAQVTGFGATSINVDIPFNATDTGVATRTNDDFKVKGTVFSHKGQPITISTSTLETDGNTRLVSPSNHGLAVGDWVEVTGTTSYNGIHQVLRVPFPNSYVIEVAFVGSESGTSQNLFRLGSKTQNQITVGSDELFRFNFANFLAAALTSDIAPLTGVVDVITPNDNSETEYAIQWVEIYNDKNGLQTEYDTLDNNTGKQAFNATLQHQDTQDLQAYFVESAVKLFLTNQPSLLPLRRDEDYQLHFISTSASLKVRIIEYDAITAGSPTVTTSASKTIIDDRGIVTLTGSGLLASTKRLEVRLINDAETSFLSAAQSFLVLPVLGCEKVRLTWLNRLGGFDSYTFIGSEVRGIDSEIITYTKGLDIGFDVQDAGETILGVTANNEFSIWSEFVKGETAEWLEELITSPQVYLVDGTDHVPVIVTSRGMKTKDSEDVVQFNITYRMANKLILQNG